MSAGLWRLARPLLLASGSQTRRELLTSAAIPLEVAGPRVDERAIEAEARAAGADPAGVATVLAAAKALDVSRRHRDRLVLGADQTLACEGTALHKPRDREEARSQIAFLSGRTHSLHSAVALARDGVLVGQLRDDARLTLRALAPEAIELYLDLAGDRATASVGAYQLEGVGIHLFERVEGDHATILGLPLLPLLGLLRETGALAL
ncbi:Maf family protein [Salinarimonas soli]|uniref:Nucleoside triphosphate pyrophosphatase n=1 Tax=Salinarimonas soli TaxID=1638099 RepID=A0A5B2VH93_9HYPH|nr:Maf family protein [Salinarimonas soli]KAA2237850.1 septum formation inhibitor Maf [Salinarimonas soli]